MKTKNVRVGHEYYHKGDRVSWVKGLCLFIILMMLISSCSDGVYPNYRHNNNRWHTDYYGNKYKFHGIFKEYKDRRYGFEANPF